MTPGDLPRRDPANPRPDGLDAGMPSEAAPASLRCLSNSGPHRDGDALEGDPTFESPGEPNADPMARAASSWVREYRRCLSWGVNSSFKLSGTRSSSNPKSPSSSSSKVKSSVRRCTGRLDDMIDCGIARRSECNTRLGCMLGKPGGEEPNWFDGGEAPSRCPVVSSD